MVKRCPRCRRLKDAETDYYWSTEPWTGDRRRQAFCKECFKADQRARRVANLDAERERCKRWREENPGYTAAKAAAWRRANPSRERQGKATYRRAHREEVYERNARRRAQQQAAKVERIYRQVVYERDEGHCGICYRKVDPHDFHLDHVVPLARGGEHSYDNIQLAHPRCNIRKGARAA